MWAKEVALTRVAVARLAQAVISWRGADQAAGHHGHGKEGGHLLRQRSLRYIWYVFVMTEFVLAMCFLV